MVLLHVLPKQHLELMINEHGDIFEGSRHLGELNIYYENDMSLVGPIGPTGPTTIGPQGPRGITGSTGIQGPIGIGFTGPIGITGIDGKNGLPGPIGIKGRVGPPGPIGDQGEPGPPRCMTPTPFISALVEKPFLYNNDTFPIIPWNTIINNSFTLNNKIVNFPKKYGVYKIEIGFQIKDYNLDTLAIELMFNNKCKKFTHLVPQSKQIVQNHSSCTNIHIIYPVEQETKMEINFDSTVDIIFERAYLSIIEIV